MDNRGRTTVLEAAAAGSKLERTPLAYGKPGFKNDGLLAWAAANGKTEALRIRRFRRPVFPETGGSPSEASCRVNRSAPQLGYFFVAYALRFVTLPQALTDALTHTGSRLI